MKRWKKITLLLLVLLVLSQLPFIYRRHRLALLREAIARLNAERKVDQNSNPFADYKGVIHVHSILGGHSTGGLSDIIRAARANALDFVIMTEHPSADLDTDYLSSQSTARSGLRRLPAGVQKLERWRLRRDRGL